METQRNNHKKHTSTNQRTLTVWRLYFLAAAIMGMVSILYLHHLQTSPLSRVNHVLAAGMGVLTLFFLFLLILPWITPDRYLRIETAITNILNKNRYWCTVLILSGFIFLGAIYLTAQASSIQEPFSRAIILHLQPVLGWLSGLGLLTLIALPITRYGNSIWQFFPKGKIFYISLGYIVVVLISWRMISGPHIKLESEFLGWWDLNAPILETQVLIAWFAIIIILLATTYLQKKGGYHPLSKATWGRIDAVIFLLFWIVAAIVWVRTPVQPNAFLSKPRAPNHEYYPNADALSYDITAQNALIGEGYLFLDTPFIRRPMHALFLTTIHAIAGQDYSDVANLQAILLAIFPGLIFLVTKAIYNRVSGILAAILILFREANAIALSGSITTANAKLLMVDLPTAIVVAGFAVIIIRWLQNPSQKQLFPLIAGGLLGVAILIRTETAVLFLSVAIVAAAILNIRKYFLQWIYSLLLITVGILLIISPWIYRNWALTGSIFLDSPFHRADLLAQRFLDTTNLGTLLTPTPSGEVPFSTPSPNATALESTEPPVTTQTPLDESISPTITPPSPENIFVLVLSQSFETISEHPKQTLLSISSHFLNNQIQFLLISPTLSRGFNSIIEFAGHHSITKFYTSCCSEITYIKQLPYWWKWDGYFKPHELFLLLINILVLSFGILASWRKKGALSIVPLVFVFFYTTFHSLLRNSGGRYLLPVDWASISYYSIGITYITENAINCYQNKIKKRDIPTSTVRATQNQQAGNSSMRWKSGIATAILLLLVGATIPLTEKAIPEKYTQAKQQEMLDAFMQSELVNQSQHSEIQQLLQNGGTISVGRALYPRFYPENVGESGFNNPFNPQPFARLVFHLAGPHTHAVIIPMKEAPDFIPNASDTLLFSCNDGSPIAVVIYNAQVEPVAFITQEPQTANWQCPAAPAK